ncbi:hypothetical protein [Glaciecola sp. 1036]|uniref:hypothetical protein n=1 Tax=Alteromonadaceae TaxID=72275 RepID=UPI003CFE8762
MSRDLNQAQEAALLDDTSRKLIFIELDWPSGIVRAHSGVGERVFQGQTYLGVGEFGGIGDFTEDETTSPTQMPITLKVLDPTLMSTIINENAEGRGIVMHLALLDENRVIEHELPNIFDGHVGKINFTRGQLSKGIPSVVKITATDWLNRWSQPATNARTTNEAQQSIHPGDRIFDLTEIVAGSPLSSLPTKTVANGGMGVGHSSRNRVQLR